MRPMIHVQMTLDDHRFLATADLFSVDSELEKISRVLDECPEMLSAAASDLHRGLKHAGAEGMAVEQVLRSAILYQLRCESYRDLALRLGTDYSFRKFSRFYGRTIPHFSCLERAIKRLGPETFSRLNAVVVDLAVKKKVEDGCRVRVDTTVAETNIHHPSDSSLLWDCVRTVNRLLLGARQEFPSLDFEYHNRTRRTKKLAYLLAMEKNKAAELKRPGRYRDLLRLSREVAEHGRLCRELLVSSGLAGRDLVAGFLRSELDGYLTLTAKCIGQCERRVLEGEKVPAGEKVVSIFEPHTDIIMRGKTRSEAEFGHKVTALTGVSGLVLQYQVCAGNPADHELLAGVLAKHTAHFGGGPRELAADRRFYHARNDELAAVFGVRRLAIPQPGHRSADRIEYEKAGWFKQLLRFRAGIEGNLSTVLRCFGLGRCLWRGLKSFESWVGLSFFAWNLKKLAMLI